LLLFTEVAHAVRVAARALAMPDDDRFLVDKGLDLEQDIGSRAVDDIAFV